MKRILALVICLVLLVSSLAGCSKPPEFYEIEDRLRELIEASYEINEIFFGRGLDVYTHVLDPRSTTDVLEGENGKRTYYYELTDDTYGRVVAYRHSNMNYFFAQILDTPDPDRTPIYADETEGVWAYEVEYEHTKTADNTLEKIEDEETGKVIYYYELTDEDLGRIVAHRYSYARYSYAQILRSRDESRTPIYTDDEDRIYVYALPEYKETEYDFYYSATDPEDYDYVRDDVKYKSILELKDLAETVYSKDYLRSLYESLFEGTLASGENVSGMSARFMEYTDDYGTVKLMQSNTYEPLVTEKRIFDLSTAQIVRPKRKKFVTVQVESYLESTPEKRETIRLSLILQDGVWMLDSGTY